MPSVNSSSRPNVWPSSTFTTPSLPTFSIASESTSPTSRSRDETVATRAMSSLPEISLDCVFRFSTTCSTAFSIPRRIAIGFAPAATLRRPSLTIACASTVAVVVPSPATSFVDVATSRTSCAPWFSNGSSTSISRAIVTPSFVIVGDLREDVRLAQDQDLVGAELDLGPAVLGEDDLVTLLHVLLDVLPVLVARTRTDCEDAAALGLLLRGVGQHDAADGSLLFLE